MSAALYLKQSIYQLAHDDLLKVLQKYYETTLHAFSATTTQKAYKCFECCITVDYAKYCAGFGRNEEEASLNAARIALESIIDSGDLAGIKKVLEPEEEKSGVEELMEKLGGLEITEVLRKEKVGVEDLKKMGTEGLKLLMPVGLAGKVFAHFHPATEEMREMKEKVEVLDR
jgi:hypothetical protein